MKRHSSKRRNDHLTILFKGEFEVGLMEEIFNKHDH